MALVAVNVLPITPAQPSRGGKKLPVPYIEQAKSQWCWAACVDMVLALYQNPGVEQCDMASWLFHPEECCGKRRACNYPCHESDMCRVYAQWRVDCNFVVQPVSFETLQYEIDAGRPVEVGMYQGSKVRHAGIVFGYYKMDGRDFVWFHNPREGVGTLDISYQGLVRAGWIWTWTLLRRQ